MEPGGSMLLHNEHSARAAAEPRRFAEGLGCAFCSALAAVLFERHYFRLFFAFGVLWADRYGLRSGPAAKLRILRRSSNGITSRRQRQHLVRPGFDSYTPVPCDPVEVGELQPAARQGLKPYPTENFLSGRRRDDR